MLYSLTISVGIIIRKIDTFRQGFIVYIFDSQPGGKQTKAMEPEKPRRVIKVEPIPDDELIYKKSDLVMAKCEGQPAWPAQIHSFIGYDKDQVQVYRVQFIGSSDYAYLETYLMSPLGPDKVQKLMRNAQPKLKRALTKVESKFQILKKKRGSNAQFRRLYEFNIGLDKNEVVDIDLPEKPDLMSLHLKKLRKPGVNYLQMDKQQVDVSVFLETQSLNQMLTRLSINNTFCSTYHTKVHQQPVSFEQVTINIKEWGQQKANKDQQGARRRRPFTRSQKGFRPEKPAMKGKLTLCQVF